MSYFDVDHESEAFEQAVHNRVDEARYKREYKERYGRDWPEESPDAPFEL